MKATNARRRRCALVGALSVALLVGACGGPLKVGGAGASGECSTTPILEQVAGMDAQARTARLTELAADEDKDISMYSSLGADELAGVLDAFADRYGVTVESFSANSEEVLQRLGSEQQAGRTQGDLVENNGTELQLASREGLLAPISSPYADPLPAEVRFPTWVGTRYNIFTVTRNSSIVSDADAPRTYLDLADPKYDGLIGVEAGNWDLFATIVEYFEQHEGMTEDQAIAVWRDITDGAKVYTSNTPLADAVEQGELGMNISYNHYYSRFVERGSTVLAWEPAIEPQVLRPNGVGIPCLAPNPATAVLLFDFFISEDGQRILGEVGNRDVTNPNVPLGLLHGKDLERVYVDLDKTISESEHWVPIYDELMRNATA